MKFFGNMHSYFFLKIFSMFKNSFNLKRHSYLCNKNFIKLLLSKILKKIILNK